MRHLCFLLFLGVIWAGAAQSQPVFWPDRSDNPVAETESMKSKNGFGGFLVATTDADWERKWSTPPETVPIFEGADVVPYGRKVYILSFFANPSMDDSGKAKVQCDIRVVDPNGKVALALKDQTCFSGRLSGRATNVYMSTQVVAFSGDPGDPAGTWSVEVNLLDANRDTELPLRTRFQLR